EELKVAYEPGLKEIYGIVRKALRAVRYEKSEPKNQLLKWYENNKDVNYDRFNSKLFTGSKESIEYITHVPAKYGETSKLVDGREILNACFLENFERDERLLAFGEDVGEIGDV